MTDLKRKQQWARGTVSKFDGLPIKAVLVGIWDSGGFVDWERAVREAKIFSLEVEQAESDARQKALKAKAQQLLAAVELETDPLKRSQALARYFRAADRETVEWKRQEDIWRRRDAIWKEGK